MPQIFPFITNVSKTSENPDINNTTKLPEYKLSEHVPKYHKYKTNKGRNIFDTIFTVEDNILRGLSLAITGKEKCGKKTLNHMKFGEQTFFTSGTCGPKSLDDCSGEPRNIIIDTVPSGKFKRKTDYRAESENKYKIGKNAGLIPSVIEDLFDFNPGEVLLAFAGSKKGRIHDVCQRINFKEKQYFPKKKKPLVKNHSICVPTHPSMLKENFLGGAYRHRFNRLTQKAPGPLPDEWKVKNIKIITCTMLLLLIVLIGMYLLHLLY